jgi:hypothetical protein
MYVSMIIKKKGILGVSIIIESKLMDAFCPLEIFQKPETRTERRI